MAGKHWKSAIHSNLDNNPSRRPRRRDFSREPELLHVQRLHRLYVGLAYFALWFLNRERSAGLTYLEKAESKLSEVESLIEFGHICDVFLQPLIQIRFNDNRAGAILPLLEKYASRQPYNPNTDRFLAEWYLHAATGKTSFPADPRGFRRALKKSLTLDGESIPPVLKHLVSFSLRLLPTPAPSNSVRGDENWHFIIADICCSCGFFTEALEIVFKLLDHPSWCGFDQPWRLLQTCVRSLGLSSDVVSKMWTLRARTWKTYIFSHPDLSPEGSSAKKLLQRIPRLKGVEYQIDDGFGCIIEVTPLKPWSSKSEDFLLNRKVYFPYERVTMYKRLLSTISTKAGSSNPEELPEFKEFQELHCKLSAAQKKALEDLQASSPCGHLVLPMDLEESFIRYIHQEQLSRLSDGAYELVSSLKFSAERASTAKLVHLMSFGDDRTLDTFSLNEKTLPRSMETNSEANEKTIGFKYLQIAPEANIIVNADVLVRVLPYLKSNSKCFFPLDVVPSPLDKNKRSVFLHKPFLGEPLQDNRLRAQECYTVLCKQAFVSASPTVKVADTTTASGDRSSSDDEMEGALAIDSLATQSVEELSPNSHSETTSKNLRAVLERCHVVENDSGASGMEVLQEPASPEPSTSQIGSPPHHFDVSSTPLETVHAAPENNRRWSLFTLGHLNILVSSCGIQLSSKSCAFTSGCLFWPNCSELWSDASKSDIKIAHLEVRPEYLQPWGCEELMEAEIFSSWLGAKLSSPHSPTILRCEFSLLHILSALSNANDFDAEMSPGTPLNKLAQHYKYPPMATLGNECVADGGGTSITTAESTFNNWTCLPANDRG
ncbi:unnamed protein product [Hydatigera taeniaeformis]|uniref:Transcription initiation factor TFIID subunit 5 n=1 Tax=Hydatigena taeniaeformis TaxID=6205 RepID=A0A0R3X6M6_HYDTA|nr:unnamed protein product [Hydatigera taeniaeformis]